MASRKIAWVVVLFAIGCNEGRAKTRDTPTPPPTRRAYSLTDYAKLCDGGENAFDGAKPHAKREKGPPSQLVVFSKYLDDKSPRYKTSRPAELEPLIADQASDVELVACVDLKRQGPPAYCNFYGGKVLVYDMTHTLRVIEAKTGKQVAKEEFVLDRKTKQCPATFTFAAGAKSHYIGPDIGSKLLSALLPFQPEDLTLPPVKTVALDQVCSGSPIPQAAAYEPGTKTRVHPVYFPTETQTFTRSNVPDGFPRARDLDGDAADYQLVACVTGIPEKKKRQCDFIGGKVLELYDGKVEVALYEARTAKLVEKKTFSASSPARCPMTHKFWGSRDRHLSRVEPALSRYLKKLEGS